MRFNIDDDGARTLVENWHCDRQSAGAGSFILDLMLKVGKAILVSHQISRAILEKYHPFLFTVVSTFLIV